jgi:exosortase
MVPWFLIIAALWAPIIYLLGAQWTLLEQYHYGWAVPFMCAFFAYERSRNQFSTLNSQPASALNSIPRPFVVGGLLVCGLCLWATRLLQEANPLWRAASYGLVLEASAIILLLITMTRGWSRAKHFIFPIAFFLVAVPWPWPIENGITQSLMRLNTAIVVELLNLFGVPTLAHGNVIEISTGVVGVEEACSGIRSLQATLMITLFFGEFYRLRWTRRIGLIFCGIAFEHLPHLFSGLGCDAGRYGINS